ncbi:MAG: tetratricopeptide repeat protein [Granulosicoccus sp.]
MNVFRNLAMAATNQRLAAASLAHYQQRLRLSFLLIVSSIVLMCSVQLSADQRAEELPELFDQLLVATSAAQASEIESQIWQHWLDAPDDSSEFLISQVSRAMEVGQMELALKLSTQLIDGTPNYAEAWNKRATIYYLMGNNDLSVADIRETLALEPRHFGAISGLGLIFMREQNLEAALQAFEQVLAISPASANARNSAERVKTELGREI